jgi:hypothetical protein
MEVTFSALMKELKIKSLVSGDKDDADLISDLNKLMKADEEVKVTIAE